MLNFVLVVVLVLEYKGLYLFKRVGVSLYYLQDMVWFYLFFKLFIAELHARAKRTRGRGPIAK